MSGTTGRGGVAGSSALMFSGTLVSRLLGMVRSPLLLGAAIGANLGASDAFAVANKLPTVVYLLIAGGVLNAILVPALVRAMTRDDDGGQAYANRLLTVFGVGLLGVTLLLTALAQVLVYVYAGSMPAQWFDVAVAFAYWTVPQLFFYGMYTMLGQVLNARGVFGPYMWAPAVNNVVAIAGLGVYLWVFGTAGSSGAADASAWTPGRIALLAGTATLGIVAQALVLVIPLRRSGFSYRFDFQVRGSGLGAASRTAMWVFGAVLVGQVSNILVSQAAAGARGRALEQAGGAASGALDVAGNQAYDNAYLLYSLPTSLVVVSLVTALFTRMSTNAATGEVAKVREDTSLALRVVAVFTVFVAPAMMVLALPLTRILNAAVTYTEVRSIAAVLAAMLVGLVAVGAWTVLQRVYYAFEAARHLFWIQVPTVVVLAGGAVLAMTVAPQWTVPVIGLFMALSNSLGVVLAYTQLRRYLPDLDAGRVVRAHLRIALAAAGPVLAGWGLLHLLGTGEEMGVVGAIWRTVVVGAVMSLAYLGMLKLLKVEELALVLRPLARLTGPLTRRIPGLRSRHSTSHEAPPVEDTIEADAEPVHPPASAVVEASAVDAPTTRTEPPVPHNQPEERPAAQTPAQPVADEDLLGGRYYLTGDVDPAPELPGEPAEDVILNRAVRALRLDPAEPTTAEVLDAARRAALVRDDRLLSVLDVGQDQHDAWVVTEEVPGTGLDALVAEGPLEVEDARAVIGEAASGLEAANRHGVHHLHLEPQCVRVTREGEIVVVGVGVMAALAGASEEERAALSLLTSARTDAEALVRLMHLALTGTAAPQGRLESLDYPGETPETMVELADRTLVGGAQPVSPSSVIRALAPWRKVAAAGTDAPLSRRARTSALLAAALHRRPHGERHDASRAEGQDALGPEQTAELDSLEQPAGVAPVAERAEADVAERADADPRDVTALTAEVDEAQDDEHERDQQQAQEQHPDRKQDLDQAEAADVAGAAAAGVAGTGAAAARANWRESRPAQAGLSAATWATGRVRDLASRVRTAGSEFNDRRTERRAERSAGASNLKPAEVTPTQYAAFGEDEDLPPVAPVPTRQKRLVLGIMAAVPVIGLIAALLVLTSEPGSGDFSSAQDQSPAQQDGSQDATGTADGQDGQDGTGDGAAPTAEPAITGAALVDPEQRYPDHPETLDLALDGNPATAWRSLWYNDATYAGVKDGIGVILTLQEEAMVSKVELNVAGTGGRVFALNQPVGTEGSAVYAEATLGPDTVLRFNEPQALTQVVLWFDQLPTATENGRYMIALNEVTIR